MKPTRRASALGPLFLITVGIVFLLNNLGVLDWSIWQSLVRLWPILLIAAGLDLLIGRRSVLGFVIAVGASLALVLGGLWWLAARAGGPGSLVVHEIAQEAPGAKSAFVRLAPGAGSLHLGSHAGADLWAAGTVRLRPGQSLVEDFGMEGQTARYELGSRGPTPFAPIWHESEVWDLTLTRDMPLDLEIATGVGTSRLDLTELNVTSLQLEMGVGAATVLLPRRGRPRVRIDGGVGNLVVRVPAAMPARIEARSGLGRVSVDGTYDREGDVYTSPGFATASERIELEIEGGVGFITVAADGS